MTFSNERTFSFQSKRLKTGIVAAAFVVATGTAAQAQGLGGVVGGLVGGSGSGISVGLDASAGGGSGISVGLDASVGGGSGISTGLDASVGGSSGVSAGVDASVGGSGASVGIGVGGSGSGTGTGTGTPGSMTSSTTSTAAATGNSASQPQSVTGKNYATTCSPMGVQTYNSFVAVDRSRIPLGQIQGVVLQGDQIVQAQFLTDSAIFGVRRCIKIGSGSISARGNSVVLPISQVQLFTQIGG